MARVSSLVGFPERLVKPCRSQQNISQPLPDLFRIQGLPAHRAVRREGVDDGVRQFVGEVGRVGELFLGVVGRLLRQDFGLQQLALDDVVHVHQPVVVGQIALEQVVDLGDDFHQISRFLLPHLPASGFG